jgi:Fic family protein
MDGELWQLLSEADRALGRLDGSTETLPNPDLFVFMYLRKEAVLSSQIEGTQASLVDVLEVEAEAFDPQQPKDVDEVVNYIAAMKYGLRRLGELPVSLRLIKEIHERLLDGVRGKDLSPGEFRTSQNWIGAQGSNLMTASFVPPPPHEIDKIMGGLENFIHSQIELPILIKVGLVHAQFETIHPFLDGNGRIGRLLITFLLCEKNVLSRPLLYLSYYFKKNRMEYYDRLQAVRDHGDWEGWLKFFLRGVGKVSNEATERARSIVRLRETHRQLIVEEFGRSASSALVLLESLYERPVLQVKHVMQITVLSYPNANNLVGKFCEAGLLSKTSERARNRVFSYKSYIDLFSDQD